MPEEQNPADIPYQEQRAVPRFQVDDDATLLLVSDGRLVNGRVLDLSLKGCRMQTRDRFNAGTDVRVEVTFRVNGIAFRFFGLTQWTNQWNVVGIQFIEVPQRRLRDLAEVVGEVEEEAVARSEMQAHEELSAELSSELPSEPLAEEATTIAPAVMIGAEHSPDRAPDQARIHAVSSQRVVAGTFTHSASRQSAESANAERRVLLRQAVDTSAAICLIPGGSKQNGLILELSLNGCRIRTETRFTANIYSRAEVEFHLEGLPFRLAGVIQAVEDQRLVAIKFHDMSERKRTQLVRLIEDIEENQESGEVQKL